MRYRDTAAHYSHWMNAVLSVLLCERFRMVEACGRIAATTRIGARHDVLNERIRTYATRQIRNDDAYA